MRARGAWRDGDCGVYCFEEATVTSRFGPSRRGRSRPARVVATRSADVEKAVGRYGRTVAGDLGGGKHPLARKGAGPYGRPSRLAALGAPSAVPLRLDRDRGHPQVGTSWIRRCSAISVAAGRRQSATRRLLDLHQDVAGILGAEVRHSGRHVHRAEAGPAH